MLLAREKANEKSLMERQESGFLLAFQFLFGFNEFFGDVLDGFLHCLFHQAGDESKMQISGEEAAAILRFKNIIDFGKENRHRKQKPRADVFIHHHAGNFAPDFLLSAGDRGYLTEIKIHVRVFQVGVFNSDHAFDVVFVDVSIVLIV